MNRFVSIGFNNVVNSDKVIAVISIDNKACRTLINTAKESNKIIDATSGRNLKSIILTESERIILCGLHVDTIALRLNNINNEEDKGNLL